MLTADVANYLLMFLDYQSIISTCRTTKSSTHYLEYPHFWKCKYESLTSYLPAIFLTELEYQGIVSYLCSVAPMSDVNVYEILLNAIKTGDYPAKFIEIFSYESSVTNDQRGMILQSLIRDGRDQIACEILRVGVGKFLVKDLKQLLMESLVAEKFKVSLAILEHDAFDPGVSEIACLAVFHWKSEVINQLLIRSKLLDPLMLDMAIPKNAIYREHSQILDRSIRNATDISELIHYTMFISPFNLRIFRKLLNHPGAHLKEKGHEYFCKAKSLLNVEAVRELTNRIDFKYDFFLDFSS